MTEIVVDVVGIPAPQGSKRHVGRGILVESSKKVGPWREAVVAALTADGAAGRRIDGPVVVRLVFRLPRPSSHFGPRGLRDKARLCLPDKRPDLDKLVRSTLDALTTAAVIADDSRVIRITAGKRYTNPDEAPGCLVWVSTAEEASE